MSKTILLVDDESDFLDPFSKKLQAAGYMVITASGPEEAKAKYAANRDRIDLVITDRVMWVEGEELDHAGLIVARHIRDRDATLPIILHSEMDEVRAKIIREQIASLGVVVMRKQQPFQDYLHYIQSLEPGVKLRP